MYSLYATQINMEVKNYGNIHLSICAFKESRITYKTKKIMNISFLANRHGIYVSQHSHSCIHVSTQ